MGTMDEENYILELSSNYITFDPLSSDSSVFYDDNNRQVHWSARSLLVNFGELYEWRSKQAGKVIVWRIHSGSSTKFRTFSAYCSGFNLLTNGSSMEFYQNYFSAIDQPEFDPTLVWNFEIFEWKILNELLRDHDEPKKFTHCSLKAHVHQFEMQKLNI